MHWPYGQSWIPRSLHKTGNRHSLASYQADLVLMWRDNTRKSQRIQPGLIMARCGFVKRYFYRAKLALDRSLIHSIPNGTRTDSS